MPKPRPATSPIAFEQLLPMLLDERKLVPPDQENFLAECKYDGYRVLAQFGNGECQLRSKNGANISSWFPEVRDSLASLDCGVTVIDGEMTILDDLGRTNFDALHARARRRRWQAGDQHLTYCVFDLLVLRGRNLMDMPLVKRKAKLAQFLNDPPVHLLYAKHLDSSDVPDPVSWLFAQAVELQLEGVVAKRADSTYTPGIRSPNWIKIKRPGAVPPERFRRTRKTA